MLPSEIIARQVSCSFQFDRACIMARSVTGTKSMMWGSDYPHHEGTFPKSRDVVAHLFDGIDISEDDKADILGLNAARLFRLPRPELFVDRAAPHVVGGYLADKPRDQLYVFARSDAPMERRTAIIRRIAVRRQAVMGAERRVAMAPQR